MKAKKGVEEMPIYSRVFKVPAAQEKLFELTVEGDILDMVRIRFPPGPAALLKITIFYGNEQLFPAEEGTYFVGDNEIIEWSEYYPLPEHPTRLRIRAVNEDDTYEHSFYLVLNTKYRQELAEERLARRLASLIRPLSSVFRAFSRRRGW